jgi:hypothetical protein
MHWVDCVRRKEPCERCVGAEEGTTKRATHICNACRECCSEATEERASARPAPRCHMQCQAMAVASTPPSSMAHGAHTYQSKIPPPPALLMPWPTITRRWSLDFFILVDTEVGRCLREPGGVNTSAPSRFSAFAGAGCVRPACCVCELRRGVCCCRRLFRPLSAS